MSAPQATPWAEFAPAAPRRDDARDRRPVGIFVAGLVLRLVEEVLAYRLAGKHRVPRVDPGVDQTNRLAAANVPIDFVLQLELRVGSVSPDRPQAPLILEVVLAAMRIRDRLTLYLVCLRCQAPHDGLDARRRDDRRLRVRHRRRVRHRFRTRCGWQIRLRRVRRLRVCVTAPAAAGPDRCDPCQQQDRDHYRSHPSPIHRSRHQRVISHRVCLARAGRRHGNPHISNSWTYDSSH